MEKTGREGMLDVGKSVLRLSVNYVDIRFIASTAGMTNFFFLLENYGMDEYLPNHACWSPCTSIASPKSANLTAAPFSLLANRRFSGWGGRSQKG